MLCFEWLVSGGIDAGWWHCKFFVKHKCIFYVDTNLHHTQIKTHLAKIILVRLKTKENFAAKTKTNRNQTLFHLFIL